MLIRCYFDVKRNKYRRHEFCAINYESNGLYLYNQLSQLIGNYALCGSE